MPIRLFLMRWLIVRLFKLALPVVRGWRKNRLGLDLLLVGVGRRWELSLPEGGRCGYWVLSPAKSFAIRKAEAAFLQAGLDPRQIVYVGTAESGKQCGVDSDRFIAIEQARTTPSVDQAIHEQCFQVREQRYRHFAGDRDAEAMRMLEIEYFNLELSLRCMAWGLDQAEARGASIIVILLENNSVLPPLLPRLIALRDNQSGVALHRQGQLVGPAPRPMSSQGHVVCRRSVSPLWPLRNLVLLGVRRLANKSLSQFPQIVISDGMVESNYWRAVQTLDEVGRWRNRLVLVITSSWQITIDAMARGIPVIRLGLETGKPADAPFVANFSRFQAQALALAERPGWTDSVRVALEWLASPHRIDSLFNAKETQKEIGDLLARSKARSLLLLPHWSPGAKWGGIEALRRKIRLISVPVMTVAGYASSIIGWEDMDIIAAYGEQCVEAFVAMGYRRERLPVIGNVLFDHLFAMNREPCLQQVNHRLGCSLPLGKKVILVATSRIDQGEDTWIVDLARRCGERGDCVVLCKPHPTYASSYPLPTGGALFVLRSGPVEEAIMLADLVITDFSTVGAQAVFLKRRLMVVNTSGRPFPANDYASLGVASLAERAEDVPDLAFGALDHPGSLDQEAIAAFLRDFNGPCDGHAAARLWDLLEEGTPKASPVKEGET
ncbi:MAG: CDP-glycerol glycerophosphotransferase family protein [Alphaproteobacteria bacterium]|nr:CDP-glycerol glycerophosphotransferase family protein [Alphaproteobacteria bacterium]